MRRKRTTQECPGCTRVIAYDKRYPHRLCPECAVQLTDRAGRPLFLTPMNALPVEARYQDDLTAPSLEVVDRQWLAVFHNGRPYLAEEAPLGGIVVVPRYRGTHLLSVNNFASWDVGDDFLDDVEGMLGRMTSDGNWAYVIARIPRGMDRFDEATEELVGDDYLQIGGTPDQGFAVEVKHSADHQYAVGRAGGPSTRGLPWKRRPITAEIRFAGIRVTLRDNEVLNTSETADIIRAHFRTNAIPSRFSLRELDMDGGESGTSHVVNA